MNMEHITYILYISIYIVCLCRVHNLCVRLIVLEPSPFLSSPLGIVINRKLTILLSISSLTLTDI